MLEHAPINTKEFLFQGFEHIPLQNQLKIFYRCVLLALAVERRRFLAGDNFHAAYGEMIATEGARYLPKELQEELADIDPMFAVYSHADTLLYSGLNDYILFLEAPQNIFATFRLSQEEASTLLQKMHNEKTWRILGKALSSNLD